MKKLILITYLAIFVTNICFCFAHAETIKYKTLAPIRSQNIGDTVEINDKTFSDYINNLYRIGVSIAVGLAVLMVMWGGVEYITSDALGGKEGGKEKISQALTGLLLALGSFIILKTIDQKILSTRLDIQAVEKIEFDPLETGPTRSKYYQADLIDENGSINNLGGLPNGLTDARFKDEWNDYLLNEIEHSNLMNLSPSDAYKYFPEGAEGITAQSWANLLAGIASKESGFDPSLTYQESFKDNNGNYVISTGLLQISQESARAYGFPGITTEDLKDPQTNLRVAVKIMETLVGKYGVISGQNSNGGYIGGAAYWSTLR